VVKKVNRVFRSMC